MEEDYLISINYSGSHSTMYTTSYPINTQLNETFYDESWADEMEKVISIVVPIFFSIVALVGLFGNLLVVMVVTFNKQMRNTTNLLILNLAVADILFIVFCVPFTATGYALPHDWPFGDYWCKIVQFLIYGTAFISIYTLVLMSLDRFLAVVYPIESMTWRTERNCLFTAHGEVVTPITNHSYCIFLNNQTVSFLPESWNIRWSLLIFQVSFLGSAYLFPLLLIIGLYSVMLYRLWTKEPVGRVSAESIKNKKTCYQNGDDSCPHLHSLLAPHSHHPSSSIPQPL
ncbi:ASTA-R [Lepeophtheirus salmonis]|uniref:ASTA-R n=1 Tax=Lepeophtheirus salmonis TaxID=72036 RepID=A0A7R8CY81_LEPSM|nr:ASTA-R [Lepeophtheirus salmonis]CAF2967450.1 ASTA-R [Lepeophtheirus salmonis]